MSINTYLIFATWVVMGYWLGADHGSGLAGAAVAALSGLGIALVLNAVYHRTK